MSDDESSEKIQTLEMENTNNESLVGKIKDCKEFFTKKETIGNLGIGLEMLAEIYSMYQEMEENEIEEENIKIAEKNKKIEEKNKKIEEENKKFGKKIQQENEKIPLIEKSFTYSLSNDITDSLTEFKNIIISEEGEYIDDYKIMEKDISFTCTTILSIYEQNNNSFWKWEKGSRYSHEECLFVLSRQLKQLINTLAKDFPYETMGIEPGDRLRDGCRLPRCARQRGAASERRRRR